MSKRYVLGPAGARKLRALFNGRGVSGSVRGDAVPLALEDEFALPYEVKWAQSAASGEGSWIIWLPSDKLVVLPSGTVNPAASLTAAGGDYPVGWYVLTDAMLDRDEGGTLYRDRAYTLRPGETALVSMMHANNETGVIFPIEKLSRLAKQTDPKITFHVDATQTVATRTTPRITPGISNSDE